MKNQRQRKRQIAAPLLTGISLDFSAADTSPGFTKMVKSVTPDEARQIALLKKKHRRKLANLNSPRPASRSVLSRINSFLTNKS